MKKLTKRKIYQKRRKKEKEQQRKSWQRLEKERQQTSHQGATTAAMTANGKYTGPRQTGNKTVTTNTTKTQASHNNRYIQQSYYMNPVNSYTDGMRQWWQTYCTAIHYHSEQRRRWNEIVNKELSGIYSDINSTSLLQQYAEEYETSSDEEEDAVKDLEPEDFSNLLEELQSELEDQPVDEEEEEEQEEEIDAEYLKFLEITHRHREELKLKRAAENC